MSRAAIQLSAETAHMAAPYTGCHVSGIQRDDDVRADGGFAHSGVGSIPFPSFEYGGGISACDAA